VVVIHPVFLKIKYTVAINTLCRTAIHVTYRTDLAGNRDKAGGTVTRLLLMSVPHHVHADYEAERQGRNHSPPSARSENEWSCLPKHVVTNRNQNLLKIFDVDTNKYQT
jgi:hypothetical protein